MLRHRPERDPRRAQPGGNQGPWPPVRSVRATSPPSWMAKGRVPDPGDGGGAGSPEREDCAEVSPVVGSHRDPGGCRGP